MTPDLFEVLREVRDEYASLEDEYGVTSPDDPILAKLDALLALESRVILCEREPVAWEQSSAFGVMASYVEPREDNFLGTLHRPFRTDEEKSNG